MPPPGARLNAIHFPSGDHSTPPTGSSKDVTSVGNPPAAGIVHTCGTPVRFETKASVFPSGEKEGDRDAPTRAMRATATSRSLAARGKERRQQIDERRRDREISLRRLRTASPRHSTAVL